MDGIKISLHDANCKIKRERISNFPIEVFPPFVQDVIIEMYENGNYNMDYFAGGILSSFASSIGNKYHIRKDITWSENTSLWIVMIGWSGQNKSAPQKLAYRSIKDKQSEFEKEYKTALESYDSSLDEVKPLRKKLYTTESTFESLLKMHHDNPHGITVIPDEFKTFVDGLVGYNGASRRSSYLSVWDGAPLSLDRKEAESAFIEKPCVNIIGGIQDDVIASLKSKDTKDGFFERMLFVIPQKMEKRYVSDTPIDEHLLSVFQTKMKGFLEEMLDGDLYNDIPLSKNANVRLNKELNSHVEPSNKDRNVSGILSKLDRYMLRLALIMEVADCYFNDRVINEVSLSSMEKAILLKNYFYSNALQINDIMEQSYETNTPNGKVYSILKAIGKETFTSKEFIQVAKELHHIGRSRSYELLSISKLTQELGKGQYRSKIDCD
ncbi:DUF3987 domain-containing protein [Carboxylicivirga sediminis]|uniref:DUF3987 domain-containing protein n=1 Tax=Carboxylicivirga sediminis TaxID=2006564 RepID=A0A941F1G4_9BACT|nr:DUF3987 domain-containing protein [Carboxylicivirga sediminis]MBR8534677.1 DUF3987 domain-containing protein [Carboxylicivirga sediminis]